MEAWRVGSGVERSPQQQATDNQGTTRARKARGEKKRLPSNSILTATDLLMEGNSLGSSNGRFAHPFDAQSCDFIKSGEPVLESVIGCLARRAKGLTTTSALVATTLPTPSLVETVTDNASCSGFSRPRASPVWTAETLDRSWTLSRVEVVCST
jgi:hypothetical protein